MMSLRRLISALFGAFHTCLVGAVSLGLLAIASPTVAQAPPAGNKVTVTIEGVRNANGAVWVCLWTETQKDFPKCSNSATATARLKAPSNAPTVMFENVIAGRYAITAMHDETGTGNGETNLVGLPKSGVGLSNQPTIGLTNRPTFDKGAFAVPETKTLSIKLNYLF